MQSKSNAKNRADVKMAVAAIAITATLGLWNLFASLDGQKKSAIVEAEQPANPETAAVPAAPAQITHLPNVKILLGGTAPQPPTVIVQSSKRKSVTQTRSS